MYGWPLRSALFAVFLTVFLTACAGVPLGSGDGSFRVVQSLHFTLYTDLPRSAAEAESRRLEQLLFALHHSGWEASSDLPLKLNVVMFRRASDFEPYGGGELGGYALQEALFEPWIVLPAPRHDEALETVAHELTHGIAFQAIQRWPRWASEGVATYFESAYFLPDGRFEVGAVSELRFQALRVHGWERPSNLLWGDQGDFSAKYYGSVWLLTHYLMNQHGDAFVAYQDNLAHGLSDNEAWSKAFPTLSGEQLDAAVAEYARVGRYDSYSFQIALPEVSVVTRRLSLADEHALQAMLWKTCFKCSTTAQARWREDLRRALAADPTNVLAVALSASELSQDEAQLLTRARATVRAHPEHWLSWMSLGMAALRSAKLAELTGRPETDPGLQAVRLAPKQPYALYMAAASYLVRGQREQAIAASRAAQRLQPMNGNLLFARAALLASVSACGELREAVRQIEQVTHEIVSEAQRAKLRKQAAECQEPPEE